MKPDWDDARQDICLRAISKNRPLDTCNQAIAMQNQYCSLVRREQRETRKRQRVLALNELNEPSQDATLLAMRKEEQSMVQREISYMSSLDQYVVYRRFFRNETYKSIAASLGKKPATIRKQARRALDKLYARPLLRSLYFGDRQALKYPGR
jgi:DNA-directed RNA polymerase specialized sigma24 family protein